MEPTNTSNDIHQPTSLLHRVALEIYIHDMNLQISQDRAKHKLSRSDATDNWIKRNTTFEDEVSFNMWVKDQIDIGIPALESDLNRIKTLDFETSFCDKSNYYGFTKDVTVHVDGSLLTLGPSGNPKCTHSTWVRHGYDNGYEWVKPTPSINVKNHISAFNLLNIPVHIINSIDDFKLWFNFWGGNAVIAESIFTEPNVDTDRKFMLAEYPIEKPSAQRRR